MAIGRGVEPTRAAVLLSVSSLGAMIGSPAFGWLAERLGGAPALATGCVGAALLWTLLMIQPSYPLLMLIVVFMGFTSGGVIPMVGMAISQTFGRENFSRVLGLMSLLNLPASVAGVPLAAIIYVRTGSYDGALLAMAALNVFGALCCVGLIMRSRSLRSRPA
jgi:MFS family permease